MGCSYNLFTPEIYFCDIFVLLCALVLFFRTEATSFCLFRLFVFLNKKVYHTSAFYPVKLSILTHRK